MKSEKWEKKKKDTGDYTRNREKITLETGKGGIHLLELGKGKLAQNFIYVLNNLYWLSPGDVFLEITYIQKLHTKILNLHTLNYQTVKESQLKTFRKYV